MAKKKTVALINAYRTAAWKNLSPIGAVIAGAAFYLINRYNENEQKEAFAELIKYSNPASSNALKDAVNDPKASLVVEKALNIIITGEGYYYYQDQDCSNCRAAHSTASSAIS